MRPMHTVRMPAPRLGRLLARGRLTPGRSRSYSLGRVSKTPTTFVWLFDTFTVSFGPLNEAPLHTHPIAQITLGIEAPLRIHGASGPIDAWAVFIPPEALHRSEPSNHAPLTVYLDPAHALARSLAGRGYREVTALDVPPEQRAALAGLSPAHRSCAEARVRFESLLACYGNRASPSLDPRVTRALRLLRSDDGKQIGLAALAKAVGLSAERLRHLVREQVGMPFSRYRLWLRLGDAAETILAGASFTDAAHVAGFADSAHLARTFRQVFGDSISGRLLAPDGSRFIQAVRCRDS